MDKPDLNKPVFKVMPEAAQDIIKGRCPTCQSTLLPFRDEESRREYMVSGMCQDCQDNVFG